MLTIFTKSLFILKHRGVQVLLLLTIYFLIANILPLTLHQGFYTISLLVKDVLMWVLPITVSFFIAYTLCSFQKQAPLFVLALIVFEGLSNLCSIWYGFGCGHAIVHHLPPIKVIAFENHFHELWRLPFSRPAFWSAEKGTFFGLILGLLAAFSQNKIIHTFILQGNNFVQWLLTKVFARLIPLFVLGFVAKMHQTALLQNVLSRSTQIVGALVLFLTLYILLLFFLGNLNSFPTAIRHLRNLLPAGSIAFFSGCSLSTMPWTIQGTSKNLQNPKLAQALIPATTNIQQIGDCITQVFLCFLIYTYFYGHPPAFLTWINFSLVFVLARFATAAVLGGAIFIMLPIYENTLSFTPEMISIVLAFNILLDPLITSCNVIANGALCRIFEKIWTPISEKSLKKSSSAP